MSLEILHAEHILRGLEFRGLAAVLFLVRQPAVRADHCASILTTTDQFGIPGVRLQQIVQAIVTVLAVINPIVCGSMLLTLTPGLNLRQKRRAAVTVAIRILIILAVSALIGLQALHIFGISLNAFRTVGGMIIAYMGFNMLSGRHTVARGPLPEVDTDARSSLLPLIMFAAGPGTITAVVTLAAVHTPDSFPVTALTAAAVGAAVTFIVLLIAIRAGSDIGQGTQDVVTRFMWLIVASMGVQFILTGFKAFMQT